MFGPAVAYLRFRALGAPFGGLEANVAQMGAHDKVSLVDIPASGSMLLALTGICRGLGDARKRHHMQHVSDPSA